MSDGEESVKKISVTVKTPKEKQTVEVVENATISEVSAYLLLLKNNTRMFSW